MQTATLGAPPAEAPPTHTKGAGRPRRRWLVVLIAGTVLAGLVYAGFAWFGMLPWRGPLDAGPYQPNGIEVGLRTTIERPIVYTSLWVYNPSRVAATMDSVEPADPDPNVRVVEAWFITDSPRCNRAETVAVFRSIPDDCKVPVEGHVVPAGTEVGDGPRLNVVLAAKALGTFRSGGFDLHYHVGPIPYTTSYGNGYVLRVRPAA